MTCKACVHFALCSQFGCFESGIGDNIDYKICDDFFPNIELKPVVRGEWIDNGISGSVLSKCSVCGIVWGAVTFDFCPGCGADMRGEHNDE